MIFLTNGFNTRLDDGIYPERRVAAFCSKRDMEKLFNLRATVSYTHLDVYKRQITYNDMILFAVSRVLKNHPVLNAHFLGDHIRYFDHVHLGVAVDTPRGLIVPTIFNADCKSLCEIAKESKELATAAQGGAISPDLLTGASFTISNLGTLDIEMFTPIINPPQTGILGVNCMVDRVRTVEGQVTVYPAMGLSLTYDHRALDGAPASRFLKELTVSYTHLDVYKRQL